MDEKLVDIGLTKKEAKVYLELLKLGPQPVSILANRLGINRNTCYSVLKELSLKNLVKTYKKGSIKYFMANDPNSLVAFVDSQLRTFDYYRSEIIYFIPELRSIMGTFEMEKPAISTLDGSRAVFSLLFDVFSTNRVSLSILSLDKITVENNEMISDLKHLIANESLGRHKIILPAKRRTKLMSFDLLSSCEILYLDEKEHNDLFLNNLCIYDNKVVMINFESGKENAVIINNESIYLMQKSMFEKVWLKFNNES